jgi:hypothetical protein
MNFRSYLGQLKPAEFDRYTPPKGVQLKSDQIKKLLAVVRLLPQDRNMLLYFWRFVFDMDIKTICRYAGIEYANGVIETFRFTCRRYLEMDRDISNLGLRPVFETLIPEYEMLLVSDKRGICWFRDYGLDAEIVHSAISESDQHNKYSV